MNVAAELTRARKNHGISLGELSERTKISVERLAALERADFDHLPPVTYLRGFLRAYATEVGLDPDEIATRYIAESQKEIAEFQKEDALAEFDSEDELGDVTAEPMPILELDSLRAPIVAPRAFRARRARRSATPYALLAVAAGVAVFAGYLLSANLDMVSSNLDTLSASLDRLSANLDRFWPSRATAPTIADSRIAEPQQPIPAKPIPGTPNDEVASAASSSPSSPRAESAAIAADPAQTLRTIEAEPARGAAPEPSRATGGDTSASVPLKADARDQVTSEPPARSAVPTSNQPKGSATISNRSRAATNDRTQPALTDRSQTAAVEPDAREERRVEPETPPSPRVVNEVTGEAPADDVSGSWTMINQVASTSYNRFKNLKLGYRLQLEQSGNRVTGYGLKWMENGREIASNSRTPIMIEGIIEGRRLELRFTERGARRTSGGMFLMQLADDGSLHGSFTSDASRSSGSSQARRIAASR